MLESLSRPPASRREDRLTRFLEEEIWPLIPAAELGRAVSKAERTSARLTRASRSTRIPASERAGIPPR
jgi:hypothetical protein